MRKLLHLIATHRSRTALALLAAVTAGLLVGGAVRGAWQDRGGGAVAAPRASENTPAEPSSPVATPGAAPLRQGEVVANEEAASLRHEIALGRDRTLPGAVSAFSSYAVWLVASPAAAASPETAAIVVGGTAINPTDARLIADMQRGEDPAFAISRGAYRVLGHAGTEAEPDQVMVEITAPLTLEGATSWRTIGGVVGWTGEGWRVVSIRPQPAEQPRAGSREDVRHFTQRDRNRTLPGLGWRAFRVPGGE